MDDSNKNPNYFGWLALLALIIIGVIVLASPTADKMMKDDSGVMEEEIEKMETEDAMVEEEIDEAVKDNMAENSLQAALGFYTPYDATKIALAEAGNVVLFFRASWCPTCRALDANIKANSSSIPKDLAILDVDYDNSTELKKKYGVTYQHTLVQVDANGDMIKKWTGSPTLVSLVSEVK